MFTAKFLEGDLFVQAGTANTGKSKFFNQISTLMNCLSENLPAVLVIEDDPYMQGILAQCLNDHFCPVVFSDGMEALAYLQAGNIPDVIISDLNIPVLSGLLFLEQVKSSGFFKTIPVIILSGTESTETRIRCLESGADDFILKPFNPRELVARVRIVLKRAGKLT